VLPLVVAPDMSLKRLVVPRVAPMLEGAEGLLGDAEELEEPEEADELPDPLNADALPDDDEFEVSVLELEVEAVVTVLDEDWPENIRPRSLRLPRICGAITVANFSAWMVPATRIVRCKSPSAMTEVRTMVAGVFPVAELARLVLQQSAAPPATRIASTIQAPVLRGLRGGWRTISGRDGTGCGAGLPAALGVVALLIRYWM